MPTLTQKQKQIFDFVKDYIEKNNYSPTFEEIRKYFKLNALSGVHQHIESLIEKGLLKKNDHNSRGLELMQSQEIVEIPILGSIAAGLPIEALENKDETITLFKKVYENYNNHYALRVVGNSMVEDGIYDGDIVVIKKQPYAEDGQTVVAIIDDNQATLKKIYKEKGRFRLQPANQAVLPFFRRDIEIRGVVVKIIRDFQNQFLNNEFRYNGQPTYISLFSGGGVGCHGFKTENFECIATAEFIKKRLEVQKYNKTCKYDTGYIDDDLTKESAKQKIFNEINLWKKLHGVGDVDVIIATPPCQGMSVANHKKKNEMARNSLVIESIKLTKEINPKFFIFENVRAFLKTTCIDLDKKEKTIQDAISTNLDHDYKIAFKIINFKHYGNPSSRTRTLVIGVRRDLQHIEPYSLFPDVQPEKTLRKTIGHLKSLKKMGEICADDIYHNFRSYSEQMLEWIKDIKEGQSAFDNEDANKRPHTIKNGKVVFNQNKNGDKYSRCYWDKTAPCIHTRNDILASQSTIHPTDNRVFSVRELMKLMSIPDSFNWSEKSVNELNNLNLNEKNKFLQKEELNIRQIIGEAVPTIIFKQVAKKINESQSKEIIKDKDVNVIIEKNNLMDHKQLISFLKSNLGKYNFIDLSKIAEYANSEKNKTAAYYTNPDICYSIIKDLPEYTEFEDEINILEPSVGVGNFIPTIINKYKDAKKVNIDVVDLNKNSLEILSLLLSKFTIPNNININFINDDFLLHDFKKKYDIVVGNPPFGKITENKNLLEQYKKSVVNKETSNIFAFFIEKSLKIGNNVALITPKAIISAPEFNITRELLEQTTIKKISDFGEAGFKGVKIETVCIFFNTERSSRGENLIKIESLVLKKTDRLKQAYICDKKFPYWLIYRNNFFDSISKKLIFNVFKVFRDRQITKEHTKKSGKVRVIKSRNIENNKILNIPDYDCYIDDIKDFAIKKFLNKKVIIVPNLTYKPRAAILPDNAIVDGSAAILLPNNENLQITKKELDYLSSEEFSNFYRIARNFGTRSLNIDSNSVFFWAIPSNAT